MHEILDFNTANIHIKDMNYINFVTWISDKNLHTVCKLQALFLLRLHSQLQKPSLLQMNSVAMTTVSDLVEQW